MQTLVRTLAVSALALLASNAAYAESDWNKTLEAAKGQTVSFNAWGGDDERNTRGDFEIGHFAPSGVISEMPAVIRP